MIEDMHLHSNFSDGENTLEEMTRAAIDLGINRICFTDHVWHSSKWIPDYIEELKSLKRKYSEKISIAIGFEAKVLDLSGNLDIPGKILENPDYYVIAAIHRIPSREGNYYSSADIIPNEEKIFEDYITAIQSVAKNPKIHRFAHLNNLISLFSTHKINKYLEILKNIHYENNINFEINIKYDSGIFSKDFIDSLNCKINIASDSHSIENLRFNIERIKKMNEIYKHRKEDYVKR